MDYKEILEKARKTGKGFANNNFKEKATYIKSGCLIKNGYTCPHCQKHDGYMDKVLESYETPEDIEYMCNKGGYSWTEDRRCNLCGGLYSLDNGC